MELKEALDIVSYKIGLRFGETALGDELFLDEKIHEAIRDKAAGNGSEKEIDLKVYMQATHIVSAERTRLFQVKNEKFLTDNATNSDVKTTDSGLQYKVIKASESPTPTDKPKVTDSVTVNYTGKLICGTIFDSNAERGEPSTFAVEKVITGWSEAIQLMQVGEKFEFYIPQGIGYGKRGMGSDIPPYATLIFEVELLAIS